MLSIRIGGTACVALALALGAPWPVAAQGGGADSSGSMAGMNMDGNGTASSANGGGAMAGMNGLDRMVPMPSGMPMMSGLEGHPRTPGSSSLAWVSMRRSYQRPHPGRS